MQFLIEEFDKKVSSEDIIDVYPELISDKPTLGPLYILPNGKFLNLNLKFNRHQEYFIDIELELDTYIDTLEIAEDEFGWLRCNSGSTANDDRTYISLSHKKLTCQQYDSLVVWLDFISNTKSIVGVYAGNHKKGMASYDLGMDNTDYIIARIKRFYASGELYEDYHYGNLDYGKKADKRAIMSGRGTGHFGTGFYLIGHEEPNSHYAKERDLWEIDLSKYNLYRPYSEQDAFDLHDELKVLNNSIDKHTFENYDKYSLQRELYDYEDKYGNQGLLKFIGKYFIEHIDDYDVEEAVKNHKYGLLEKYIEDWIEDYAHDNNHLNWAIRQLAWRFGKSENKIRDLIKQAYENKSEDSVSTNFMKSLGYEGVNVSGLEMLDNFTYGSVVYDLKPGTYKKIRDKE